MGLGINAVISIAAGRLWQQAFALVITDRLYGAVRELRQFSNLHDGNLQIGA
ncbi:hypothetical protein D3C80_2221020 [compost metagenome]